MPQNRKIVIPVKGGWVARDAVTGRLREVRTDDGLKARPSEGSLASVKEASDRRSAALRRLADR